MNTNIHKSKWQRIETWLIAAAVLAALLLALPHRTAGVEAFTAAPKIETKRPFGERVHMAGELPFTAAEAVQYFSTVLEMSPEKGVGDARIFENQQAVHPEDRWQIAVWTEGKEMVVEFRVGGDYGLSLAREFFESPLFETSESERFYAMLNDAHNGPVEMLSRFTVRMDFKAQTALYTLTLRFTPRAAV
jgi:hypothetical protein